MRVRGLVGNREEADEGMQRIGGLDRSMAGCQVTPECVKRSDSRI